MVACSQCGTSIPAAVAGERVKQRPRKCAACLRSARRAYDESRARTVKGTYDRLYRTLRRHSVTPAQIGTFLSVDWVERTLARWGNACVISGQTLGTQLDLVPYRGFRKGVLPPEAEWLPVTTANKVALGRAALQMDQRMARWPEHVHTTLAAAL